MNWRGGGPYGIWPPELVTIEFRDGTWGLVSWYQKSLNLENDMKWHKYDAFEAPFFGEKNLQKDW